MPLVLEQVIKQKIAELAEIDPLFIHEDSSLNELGIDSLLAIELVVFVEKSVNRRFHEDRLGSLHTYGDFLREVKLLMLDTHQLRDKVEGLGEYMLG